MVVVSNARRHSIIMRGHGRLPSILHDLMSSENQNSQLAGAAPTLQFHRDLIKILLPICKSLQRWSSLVMPDAIPIIMRRHGRLSSIFRDLTSSKNQDSQLVCATPTLRFGHDLIKILLPIHKSLQRWSLLVMPDAKIGRAHV